MSGVMTVGAGGVRPAKSLLIGSVFAYGTITDQALKGKAKAAQIAALSAGVWKNGLTITGPGEVSFLVAVVPKLDASFSYRLTVDDVVIATVSGNGNSSINLPQANNVPFVGVFDGGVNFESPLQFAKSLKVDVMSTTEPNQGGTIYYCARTF